MCLHSSLFKIWRGKETHTKFLAAVAGLLLVSVAPDANLAQVLLELIEATPAAAQRRVLPVKYRLQKICVFHIGI